MISATVTGRLGADPEQKFLEGNGTAVLELRIASDGRKDGETTWIRASLFGERGAKIAPYLAKGDRVCVAGTLELRTFQRREGGEGSVLEMRVSEVDLIQDRKDRGEREERQGPPARPAAPPPRGPARPPARPAAPPPRGRAAAGQESEPPPF